MLYKDGEVQWVKVDPFSPQMDALLFPLLIQRMLAFSRIHYADMDPVSQVRELAVAACKGDPTLLLLAAVTPDGKLIGHAVCVMQEQYGKRRLFVLQSKLDVPGGDALNRGLQIGIEYARKHGAVSLIFESKRSDSAWMRALPGVKTLRHLMEVPLNGVAEADEAATEKVRE